mgnify:CR=1 FL=1
MKKILASLLAALLATSVLMSGAHANTALVLDKFPKERVTDLAALQNGAKLFVNYCLNCHAAAFMRFNRLKDIGLTEQQIKDNMLFPTDKVGEVMKVSLDPKDAKAWFGATPPDLTLVARSRAGHGGTGDHRRAPAKPAGAVTSRSPPVPEIVPVPSRSRTSSPSAVASWCSSPASAGADGRTMSAP